jgi:DNA processing protein
LTLCAHAEDWLTLSFLPGLGCVLIGRLVDETGGPVEALAQLAGGCGRRDRPGRPRFDRGQLDAARQRAQRELDLLTRAGISLIACTCPAFPEPLRSIADSPVLLSCRGDLDCLGQPAVAVIGSRAASDYGRRVAAMLAGELVSGAAYGIDAAAHRGALAAGGRTAAVLGCGVDVAYPRTHADLLREIAGQGVLLSEYPLGTRPEGFRFPARNRIISGLVQGVVVVEATEKSGSLITARLALDQGREVFAVPGRIDSPKSAGTHRLIQQGARLVQTVQDIFDELSWENRLAAPAPAQAALPGPALDPGALSLLDNLDTYARDIDTLVRRTGLPVGEIHALLLQLELCGLVRQLPGKLYERVSAA